MQSKNDQHVDDTSIDEALTEYMTNNSHMEVDEIDDFDVSGFDSKEIFN